MIFSDRVRLKIALNNLISNAVKYGFKKKDTPYEVVVSAEDLGGNFKIMVTDEGKGIPPEQLKKVFEIFFSEAAATTVESSGLGLYLVRQAIDKIDGNVSVRSKVDVGTEFEINLPDLSSKN